MASSIDWPFFLFYSTQQNYSFSGAFSTLSKLVVIAVMLRGRHRGLPVAIDRAVVFRGYDFPDSLEDPSTVSIPRTNTTTADERRRGRPADPKGVGESYSEKHIPNGYGPASAVAVGEHLMAPPEESLEDGSSEVERSPEKSRLDTVPEGGSHARFG